MNLLDTLLRCVAVLVVFMTLPLVIGQTEHKVMAHMQGGSVRCTRAASTAGPSWWPTA